MRWLAALAVPVIPAAAAAGIAAEGDGAALLSALALATCLVTGAASALAKINADQERPDGPKIRKPKLQFATDMLGSLVAGMLAFYVASARGVSKWELLAAVLLASWFGIAIFNWIRAPLSRAIANAGGMWQAAITFLGSRPPPPPSNGAGQ